jgi:hypothetical protein
METQTYTNFAGADIVVTLNEIVFGEIQAITYAVHREIAPLYTMGSPNPRGFAKNKRGISGTMVFLNFDKDALINSITKSDKLFSKNNKGKTAAANFLNYGDSANIDKWNEDMQSRLDKNVGKTKAEVLFAQLTAENIRYADQIPPFQITITMANEYGAAAALSLYGVQIMNEGSGVSIDDLVSEKAITFVATDIEALHSLS